MNILFVINSLLEKAGSERVACQLANLFQSEFGYNVTLVNRVAQKEQCAFHVNDEVNYHLLDGGYIPFYFKLQKLISDNEYDIVIVHNMGKMSLLCTLLNLKNTRLISLEHVAFSSRTNWIKCATKYFYKKVHTIITLTDRDKNEYMTWHPKVERINNISPYEIQKNYSNSRCKKVIAVGRLTYQKNFQTLITAWKNIEKKIPDWTLEIYGKGEDESELIAYIDKFQIKNIHLKGVCSDMQNVYASASFLVMSSRYEGLPMVLIESQSFGLPIVAFDCPFGPREIVEHQKNGLLVEDQNLDKFSEAILYLATNEKMLNEYSKEALLAATRYDQEIVLNEWKNKVLYK